MLHYRTSQDYFITEEFMITYKWGIGALIALSWGDRWTQPPGELSEATVLTLIQILKDSP